MDSKLYRTSEFAQRAAVSARTLRYYDRVGLLSPSAYSEAGYRLYTDDDLVTLQYILGLKFLGFSLEEIKVCLVSGPKRLDVLLAQQKAMMQERREQLNLAIRAIERAEQVLSRGAFLWDEILQVIQVIQVEQKEQWVDKYFTKEQQEKMNELSQQSYSAEAKARMAARPAWSEEDQKRVDAQYADLADRLRRLVASRAAADSPEAQEAAKLQADLLHQFTQGDPEIEQGLQVFWKNLQELPKSEQPPALPWGEAEQKLLNEAMRIYRSKHA